MFPLGQRMARHQQIPCSNTTKSWSTTKGHKQLQVIQKDYNYSNNHLSSETLFAIDLGFIIIFCFISSSIDTVFMAWSQMCSPYLYQLFPVPKYYFANFFISTGYFQLEVGTCIHLQNDMMNRLELMIFKMFAKKIDFIHFSVFKMSKMCNPKFLYAKIEVQQFCYLY